MGSRAQAEDLVQEARLRLDAAASERVSADVRKL
jgi:hypothetical protein